MSLETTLSERSHAQCELCASAQNLSVYHLPPVTEKSADKSALLCSPCLALLDDTTPDNDNHWRCLSESMWSEFAAVQVLAWRVLTRLSHLDWAQDLLGQLYLDDDTLAWAKSGLKADSQDDDDTTPTKDSNGTILTDGDAVTLIKDLDVKGANFTAKRGTVVKNIALTNNPAHIEGRVNGTQIVLLTCYLKKA